MRFVPNYRIPDIVKVGYLGVVEDNAVFKLARIAKNHAVADDHVFPDIAAASDFAVFSDPCRTLNRCPVFDQGPAADVDIFADEGAAKNAPVNSWFEAKLKIACDLLKRIPHVRAIVEECAVFRLVEIKEIPGLKHKELARQRLRPARWKDLQAELEAAPIWVKRPRSCGTAILLKVEAVARG